MRICIYAVALFLALTGCTSQPPPPPKPDLIEAMVSVASAFGQTAHAAAQAPGIRADTSVLFPPRSQAIALGLLSYRAKNGSWPATTDELRAYFDAHFQAAAPPDSEFADLTLQSVSEDRLSFSFKRMLLADEHYVLSADGTISFPLPARLPASSVTTPPPQPAKAEFPWGELVARLFVELPFQMLAGHKK